MGASIGTIQPPQLLEGIILDPHSGAREGFVGDALVRPQHTLKTGKLFSGTILRRGVNGVFAHGMSGTTAGTASGAQRPRIEHDLNDTVTWSAQNYTFEDHEAQDRMPDFYRLGGSINETEQMRLDAIRWQERETQAINGVALGLQRMRDLLLCEKLCGPDHAGGPGIAATKQILSAMPVGVAGSGGNVSDENFPLLDMIRDMTEVIRALTGANEFDIVLGRQLAKKLNKNNELRGTRIIGTPAQGLVGVRSDSFSTNGVAAAIVAHVDNVANVHVASALMNTGTVKIPNNVELWPEALTIIGMRNNSNLSIDGANIRTESCGLIRLDGHLRAPFMTEDAPKRNFIWAAEKMDGFEVVDAAFVHTIFTDK